jgi:hypothetical protein
MNRKKDENQLAKSVIDDIIDWSESDNFIETESQKIARQGGKARAAKLTPEKRSEIAKKAAQSRWKST